MVATTTNQERKHPNFYEKDLHVERAGNVPNTVIELLSFAEMLDLEGRRTKHPGKFLATGEVNRIILFRVTLRRVTVQHMHHCNRKCYIVTVSDVK